tara:strand:+ start:12431 stop:13807 length:1377 start_codon:yes stop_codon:yes gene_type:complete
MHKIVTMNDFKNIPSIDRILKEPSIKALLDLYSHDSVVKLVQRNVDNLRNEIKLGKPTVSFKQLINNIELSANENWLIQPSPVINASGVILHTNLGRSPISNESIKAIVNSAGAYTDLEYEPLTGKRSNRQRHVQNLINQITGSESALVVNNNAAAALLCLTGMAKGKEVIVSKGESVEIGGNFRIPDLLEQSGAKLIEVGTTNRTYLSDYQKSINENTGAILIVHTSNFKKIGFTHTPSIKELAALGNNHNIPVLNDLGSGTFIDTTMFGLISEPTVQESLEDGADLTFFSGDKLLGGPQCGIILGSQALIDKLSKHPLARALRIDKLNLTALHSTLLHYVSNEPLSRIPIWGMISADLSDIKQRATDWLETTKIKGEVIKSNSTIGGGSLPGEVLNTYVLAIEPKTSTANKISAQLRSYETPIIARIESDQVILDARTVLPDQDNIVIRALKEITI